MKSELARFLCPFCLGAVVATVEDGGIVVNGLEVNGLCLDHAAPICAEASRLTAFEFLRLVNAYQMKLRRRQGAQA